MAALIKCPKCGSNRLEPVKQAGGKIILMTIV